MQFIDLKTQYQRLKTQIDANIQRVLDHGQYILGPEVAELEKRLAQFVGVKHCLAVSSGTDALLVALMATGIQPGDEVITSPFTFIANAEMIALIGAKPVFVDIDPDTYNMDPRLIEAVISARTKAIMPVCLYGQCADMDAISAIARKHNLILIEDAAQSFGAQQKGKRSCGFPDIGCTSFFPSKPLGGYGDSGAVFTDDDRLAKIMREIHVHGQESRYYHTRVGINGRMDSMQAAILLAKLEVLAEELLDRVSVAERYSQLLAPHVKVPTIRPENVSAYAQYTIEVSDRENFQTFLQERGIPTAVHYPLPIHLQPAFAYLGHQKNDFPVCEHAAERVVSLPMHAYLQEEQQARIIDVIAEWGN